MKTAVLIGLAIYGVGAAVLSTHGQQILLLTSALFAFAAYAFLWLAWSAE